MRSTLILAALAVGADAYVRVSTTAQRSSSALGMGYVPDGLTAEQYAKMKKKEAEDRKTKKFAAGGTRGFQSRSMASFIMAKEAGQAEHLFPVDPEKVKSGEIPLKDVPYMQRGGSWDNSDLAGKKGWMKTGFGMTAFNDGKAKKFEANKFDKKYNNAKPNIGIFGDAGAVDWTGRGARAGDGKAAGGTVASRAARNGISADQQMWRDSGALGKKEIEKMRKRGSQANINQPEKKFFGLF